jgi:hypothetical protein
MTTLSHRTSLRLEGLEQRLTPANFGNPWADARHLTISFAPDGTDIAGTGSTLHQELTPTTSEALWKQEILRAFQTWAYHANVNLAVVADDGSAFGSPGPVQGNGRHGDIRIGARPLDASEIAVGTPFDLFDSWSGEVVFNSAFTFSSAGAGAGFDLFTVALQEAGHVLGLGNSPNLASAMYTQYQGTRTGLSVGDVASIQALYGPRVADRYEGSSPAPIALINSLNDIHLLDGTIGVETQVVAADIGSRSDVDWYQFNAPLLQRTFDVSLQTSGISSLRSKLTVYDYWGRVVGSEIATDPTSGDLRVRVRGFLLAKYYVRVESAGGDAFGAGAYRLAVVSAGSNLLAQLPLPFLRTLDQLGNEVEGLATNLGVLGSPRDGSWDATYRSGLWTSTDIDTYRIRTGTDETGSLVVFVTATGSETFDPWVEVRDAAGNLVAAEVLSRQGGTMAIQVRDPGADREYFVRVRSRQPSDAGNRGDYLLAIDSRSTPVELTTYAELTLSSETPSTTYGFVTQKNQLHHFVFDSPLADPSRQVELTMTIRDENGQVIRQVSWNALDPTSFSVLLDAGNYSIEFAAMPLDGGPLPLVHLFWKGLVRNDPIGPASSDPSNPPPPPPPVVVVAPGPPPTVDPYDPV